MSLSDLSTLAAASVAALEAGDYSTAIRKALACKPLLAILPDSARGSQSLRFRTSEDIDGFIRECRKLQASVVAATGGVFGQSPITYERCTETSGY